MPLLIGAALVGVFVYLLIALSGPSGARPSVGETKKPAVAAEKPKPPSLQEIQSRPPIPPPGPGLMRWAIDHLPEGWDPELAERIAKLFEAMTLRNITEPEAAEALVRAREEIVKLLAGLGPEAIPTLNAILNAEMDFGNRRFLLYALGNLGPRSEEATFALMDFYAANRDILEAQNEVDHIIKAMGNLKNETSYQQINSRIDDPATPDRHRDKFIQALGDHPQAAGSLSKFVEYMDYGDDANIRNHSAQAIGKIKDPGSLDSLIGRYSRETFTPVRQTILGSIGKIGDEKALPFLEEKARTAERDDRLSAAAAIYRIGTLRSLKILRSVVGEERDEKLRGHFMEWIQELEQKLEQAPNRR